MCVNTCVCVKYIYSILFIYLHIIHIHIYTPLLQKNKNIAVLTGRNVNSKKCVKQVPSMPSMSRGPCHRHHHLGVWILLRLTSGLQNEPWIRYVHICMCTVHLHVHPCGPLHVQRSWLYTYTYVLVYTYYIYIWLIMYLHANMNLLSIGEHCMHHRSMIYEVDATSVNAGAVPSGIVWPWLLSQALWTSHHRHYPQRNHLRTPVWHQVSLCKLVPGGSHQSTHSTVRI